MVTIIAAMPALISPERNAFTRYQHDPHDPRSLVHNHVQAIYEDSRGTLWVGTWGDGLHAYDREIFGVPDVPCTAQVVDTRNSNGNIHLRMQATVPNGSARAVQVTFGNPLPIPCTFPTDFGLVSTTKYQFTISRTGQFTGVCHVSD